MKFLIWSIVVILFLALVNAVATWFGLDVASAGEETHETGQGHGSMGNPTSPHHPSHSGASGPGVLP